MFGLSIELTLILFFCLIAACAFEFINGFHDTANAVANVIYTKTLKPVYAVMWSGLFNFLGVLLGGISVAMGIMKLLPTSVLVDQNVYHSLALILALIFTAIIWNLGTWYIGLPCSSSHTLIGSIFGVGIAYMLLPDVGTVALNWTKVKDAGLSLLISPVIGFGLALGLYFFLKKVTKKNRVLFEHDERRKHPPIWVRAMLIFTCTSVSFAHGSNDGQKGVGLVMIILIAFLPAKFILNPHLETAEISSKIEVVQAVLVGADTAKLSDDNKIKLTGILTKANKVEALSLKTKNGDSLTISDRYEIRRDLSSIQAETKELMKITIEQPQVYSNKQVAVVSTELEALKKYTEYAPYWVILMISISLGLGTMIGWKRIVVTIGEKIGKTPLTYAQGVSADFVTASTIAMASNFGLPVSTTHVLSSGVAGTMVARNGLKNLRKKTIRNILTAWLITLPVTIVLSAGLFLLLRWIFS